MSRVAPPGAGPQAPERAAGNRFAKGKSGNPSGRPKAAAKPATSAFDLVIEKTLTLTQGGETREVTLDEALQHKTYQDAVAGSRSARREVMKWITRREKAIAAKAPHKRNISVVLEHGDPANADKALVLLGIAKTTEDLGYARLALLPWAVQAALDRRGRARVSAQNLAEAKRCTLDPHMVKWPRGTDA